MTKNHDYLPTVLAFIMVVAMVAVAEVSKEGEIIFPEIAALVIGGWIAREQPWEVNRTKQVILMAIAAFFGIAIVRFLPLPLLAQVLFSFIGAALLLTAFKCTFLPIQEQIPPGHHRCRHCAPAIHAALPILSACILPVLMGVESLVYPVSVIVMTLIIATVQKILEHHERHAPVCHVPYVIPWNCFLKRLALLCLFLGGLGWVALYFGYPFVIAPPLVVAMAELSHGDSPLGSKLTGLFPLVLLCGIAGAGFRLLITVTLGLPLTLTAALAMGCALVLIHLFKLPFPPAGAIALLPLIIPQSALITYPIQVVVGFVLLTLAARFTAKVVTA